MIIYVRNDIANKQLIKDRLSEDIEGVFVEINIRKIKRYYLEHTDPVSISRIFLKTCRFCLDTFRESHKKFLFPGDFNTEDTAPDFSEFLTNYDCNSLVKDKTNNIISFQQQ